MLDRLPTKEEAETIRDILVVSKKRAISDAERERLRTVGLAARQAMEAKLRPQKEPENHLYEAAPPPSDAPEDQG
jgi:hypothetical protein